TIHPSLFAEHGAFMTERALACRKPLGCIPGGEACPGFSPCLPCPLWGLNACSSYAILSNRSSTWGKEEADMAKATTTIRQSLTYQPQYAHYFAENAALFNRVVSFYFDCIQAHEGILALPNKEALTALERLTHETS